MRGTPLLALLALCGPALAQGVPEYASMDALPAPVRAAFAPQVDNCEWDTGHLRVEAFGGGLLYAVRCPSNHANQIYAYVLARDASGAGAAALLFPTPDPAGEPLDSLSNAEPDSARREITHFFTNPEEPPCRTEARWRIDGTAPKLIFWREAAACEGGEWNVKVGKAGN